MGTKNKGEYQAVITSIHVKWGVAILGRAEDPEATSRVNLSILEGAIGKDNVKLNTRLIVGASNGGLRQRVTYRLLDAEEATQVPKEDFPSFEPLADMKLFTPEATEKEDGELGG